MIHFTCAKCGKSFTATNDYAGKNGKCTRCNSAILIPAIKDVPLPELQKPKGIHDESQFVENNYNDEFKKEASPEAFKRKLLWPLDIFLYPANRTGVTMLLIMAGIPLVAMTISTCLSIIPVIGVFVSILAAIILIVVNVYSYVYFCQCVQNSAQGYVRLSVGLGDYMDFWDAFLMMFRIVVSIVLFAAPAFAHLYLKSEADDIPDFIFNFPEYNKPDEFFYYLLAIGAALFPMALLSIIMHESFAGLNPFLILSSLLKTHVFYIGFIVIFWVGIFSVWYIRSYCLKLFSLHPYFLLLAISAYRFIKIYLMMVIMHLMGRFYYKNSERLNWI
jgi:DNA-directed RNA polymerase subunit RPC12/RpoP